MKNFSAILILVLVFSSPYILSAQGKTIKINIINKRYVPPGRTPKIPQEFKDQGASFMLRAGDVVKICNADKFVAKPFSLSKENSFKGLYEPGGLHPGNCISLKAQNPGNKPVLFWLHDEMHDRAKILMVVVPANYIYQGEEDTPPNPVYDDPGTEYPVDEKGEIISDKPNKACSKYEAAAFSRVTGSWKSYGLKLTITGSCDKITGSMEWVEWCSGVDDKTSNYQKYPGTFTGYMDGDDAVVKWSIPKLGPHPVQNGTAYIYSQHSGTTVSVSGFGCGNGELKKD
jgi:hypothetical protein